MGDNCNNCPENNPECSRTTLRIDNVEKWQKQHDDRFEARERNRNDDARSIKRSLAVAVVMMLLNLIYGIFIQPRINKDELRQEKRYQGYELHNGRDGSAHADSTGFKLKN